MKNFYDELEVSRNASPEIINKAYKVLAKKYHPDSTSENKDLAEERFKKISEAYEVLSNEEKRKEYDNQLNITQPQISMENYNQLIEENKMLTLEITNLKRRMNHQSSATAASPYQNVYHTSSTTNVHSPNHTNTYQKQKQYQSTNTTNTNNTNSYSFIDLIKDKLDHFLRNILAFVLTVLFLFVIICILLYIPATKGFLLNNFNFLL